MKYLILAISLVVSATAFSANPQMSRLQVAQIIINGDILPIAQKYANDHTVNAKMEFTGISIVISRKKFYATIDFMDSKNGPLSACSYIIKGTIVDASSIQAETIREDDCGE